MTDTERLARIEEKLDALALRFDDYRVQLEQRVSGLETKASIVGAVSGILAAVGIRLWGPK